MGMRHAAVVAGLALGLMSGTAKAVPITYDVDYTVGSSTVTGFIETDGKTDQALQASDILSFSIQAGGDQASRFFLQGSSLSATTDGYLEFSFSNNYDQFRFLDPNGIYVAEFNGTNYIGPNIYANPGQSEYGPQGDIFIIGSSGASLSTVPLPASAPMFGAALIALGAAGYGLKRKSKATAPA